MSERQDVRSAFGDAGEPAGSHKLQPGVAYGSHLTRWFLAGGLLLFLVLMWRVGPGAIGQLLWKAGWALPLVFVPYALVIACEALGWWFAFPSNHQSIRFNELVRLTVATKAVQFLTPSITQAGEFMKVHLLRMTGVKVDISAASVVVAKTTITIAELLFIGLGLTFVLSYMTVEPIIAMSVALGIVVMGVGVVGVLIWQRIGLFRPLIWVSRRIGALATFVDRHEKLLSSTESIIREHLDEKRRFGLSCLWFFLGWASGIVEAWAFLSILGLPYDVSSALVIQVWSVIVTRLTTFIPGNLGAQEAGIVMIFSFLGFSPESAMAFAVLRRLRQLGWIAAGLGYLAKMSRG
jgi:glycosyltransferase 2 family protein